MPAVPVKFREDHTYEGPRGVILPGITSRLRLSGLYYEFSDTGFMDPDKGNRIHAAIHYAIEGDLDGSYERDNPSEYAYVQQALEWIKAEDVTEIKAEYEVGNLDYGYATKLDMLCRWRGKLTVANWKTGAVRRAYAIQSALEALIFSPEPVQRLGIHLTGEPGKPPKLQPYTDRKDFEIAKAGLTCSAWVDGGKR